jgi:predicted RND superfamily exporter protein
MPPLEKFASTLARAQIAHPWRFLGAALALTVLGGILASGLVFDSRYEALLPEGAPQVVSAENVRSQTGGTRQLLLAIGGADAQKRLEFGKKLLPRLKAIPQIRFADLRQPVEFFQQRAVWMLPTSTLDEAIPALEEAVRIAKWQANPMNLGLDPEADKKELDDAWKKVEDILSRENEGSPSASNDGVLVSKDDLYTFLTVIPAIKILDLKAGHAMMAKIRAAVTECGADEAGIEVRYAGTMPVFHEQHATMKTDMAKASMIALIFGVLIVAGLTRRLAAPLVVGLALIGGVSWTFGLARVMIGNVNIITGFLVSVLFGLGIDFGVHLFVRYQQERAAGLSTAEAIERTATGTLPPAFTSALTTAGTFLSFVIAEFRGFSEFGLIAGVGVLLTLASAFLVIPALLVLLDRRKEAPSTSQRDVQILGRRNLPMSAAWGVVLAFVALALYGAVFAKDIPFRNDFTKLRGKLPSAEFYQYATESLGMSFNPAVVLVESLEDARKVAAAARARMDDTSANGPGKPSLIGQVVALSDLLPKDVEKHEPRVARLREILLDSKLDEAAQKEGPQGDKLRSAREMVTGQPWQVEDIPELFARRLRSLDGVKYIVFVWPKNRVDADYWLLGWEDELQALSAELSHQGVEHGMADETLVAAWINRMIVADGPPLIVAATTMLLLFLFLDFRSIKRTLLVAVPLAVGLFCFLAVMRLAGMELNMFNLVVLPSIVGIGVDNAVHFYHRYRAEKSESLLSVVRRVGAAALLCSLTTAVGFGSSLISFNVGLQSLGALAVLGIAATFLSDIVFFPCLIRLLERRQAKGQEV